MKRHPGSSKDQWTCFCFLYGIDPELGLDFESYRTFRRDTFDEEALDAAQSRMEAKLRRHIEVTIATDATLRRRVRRARDQAKSHGRSDGQERRKTSTIQALLRAGVVDRLNELQRERGSFESVRERPKDDASDDDVRNGDRGALECKCCR
jgi:hypothetical protein